MCHKSDVYFRKTIDDQVIKAYVKSGEPFGKAGAYGIQGIASTLIERVDGDFYSVWGFPISEFCFSVKNMMTKLNKKDKKTKVKVSTVSINRAANKNK